MAEILDQESIDDLLNSTLDLEETEDISEHPPEPSTPSGSKKIIKPVLKKRLHFDYKYISPIIKKQTMVVDPVDENIETDSMPVVWTLKSYNFHRRNKSSS